MKLNGYAIATSVLAFIIASTVFCIIGFLLDSSLVDYTPEIPDLFRAQREFGLATLAIGLVAAVLFYPKRSAK